MYLKENYIQYPKCDTEKGYRAGESGPYEAFTEDVKRLFRSLSKEYGRCVSRVYIDENGESKPIGWVFQKRKKYEDVDEYYILETWVTLHEKPDEVTRKEFFHYLNK